jgi:UDP-N-acetylmuramyl tripeptide synthase
VPIAFGGFARHNIANALAASAGARALGATIAEVRRGLLDFRPTAGASPGRLNVFRADSQVVIVDFAHNEAGIHALFDVAEAIAGSAAVTAIIGTAGDRPDDTLRGMGRIAAERASRIAIKETLTYLRGRSRAGVIGEIRAGAVGAGWKDEIPVYESEPAALRGELDLRETSEDHAPRIIALLCHEDRDGVFKLLDERGFQAVDSVAELTALLPEARSGVTPKRSARRSS